MRRFLVPRVRRPATVRPTVRLDPARRRPPRAAASVIAAALGTLLWVAAAASADVLILTDGTRLEGTVRKTDDGYSVTDAAGAVTNVPADKVARFQLRGENAAPGQTDVRLASLRRSVANLADLALIIGKYESFVAQNAGTDAGEEARRELEQWRDFQARGLVKHGGEWVTTAERDRRLQESFLQVSEARMQIKQGEAEAARQTLRGMIEVNPNDVSALYLMGVLEMRADEIGKAKALFEKVRAQVKGHAPTLVNLAAINIQQDRHPRALTFLAEAMAAQPGNREILDNVAEALNLLPEKVAQARAGEQARQLFLSQDAALRRQMGERGLYRWGSTWVEREQLDQLQTIEREINQKVEALQSQYLRLQGEVASIERRFEENKKYMARLEQARTYVDEKGRVFQRPLPPEYFEAQRDQQDLTLEREAKLNEMNRLDAQAAQERARFPTPPYKGRLEPIGEDGVPVRLPGETPTTGSVKDVGEPDASDADTPVTDDDNPQ